MSGSKFKCVSFTGAGFLISYELGTVWAIASHASTFLAQDVQATAGSSAGSLAALALAMAKFRGKEAMQVESCKELIVKMTELANAHKDERRLKGLLPTFKPKDKVLEYMKQWLERFIPEDAYEIVTGHCFLSVTRLKGLKNELISDYKSNADLIDALVGSCYIPGYFGFSLPECSDKKVLDGCFTEPLPIPPSYTAESTLSISPYQGKVDICPYYKRGSRLNVYQKSGGMAYLVSKDNIKRSIHCLRPPSGEKLLRYFDDGYKDALEFLRSNGLCDK